MAAEQILDKDGLARITPLEQQGDAAGWRPVIRPVEGRKPWI